MSVIRVRRKNHFTQVANFTLRDASLSLQAKGLLGVMLSFPDDWAYNLSHLEGKSTNGRDAHRSALRELIAAGYAKWETVHGEGGKLEGRDLIVSDEPVFKNDADRGPENPSDGSDTVRLENRRTGEPSDGKPATTKNDSTKNESTKNQKEEEGRASESLKIGNTPAYQTLRRVSPEARRELDRMGNELGWKFRFKNLAAERILLDVDAGIAALKEAHKRADSDGGSAFSYFEKILDNPQPAHRKKAPRVPGQPRAPRERTYEDVSGADLLDAATSLEGRWN